MLARHGRKLGPDPASNHACTIGGVIANNAGGMRCTVARDAYHTVTDLTFVLPSGTVIDTAAPGAEAAFAEAEPALAQGLMKLRAELLADTALTERVRRKYSIRNTHGLRLLALLDGETPLQIFRRLMVGSEGILGLVAEAVIETVPTPAETCVAWIPLASIDAAVALVPDLVKLGAAAVELMLAPALTAAGETFPGTPAYWRSLDPKAAALLVEFGAESAEALQRVQAQVATLTEGLNLLSPLSFTSVTEAVELAWHVREGCSDWSASSGAGQHADRRGCLLFRQRAWRKERAFAGAARQRSTRLHPRRRRSYPRTVTCTSRWSPGRRARRPRALSPS